MQDIIKLSTTFLGSVTLIMALVLMLSILQRVNRKWITGTVMKGLLFAFAVIVTMSDPIQLSYGGIFDMRGLLIGTAAGLFGPVTGGLALAAGVLMRWGIGGTGLEAGIVGMLMAYAGGLLWRYTIKERAFETWQKSSVLGVFITAQLLGIFLAPAAVWEELFIQLTPYTLLTNVLGALLINHLISGELSFLSEAETSKIDANTDHLTGLLNRRGLEIIYPDLALQRGHPRGRALLYFDIDNFKAFNDTYGHAVGDTVLRYVTEQVASNLRPQDVFARLGGDEFAVVLSRIDATEAQRIAERCRSIVADGGFSHQDEIVQVSISVGAIWMLEHTEIDHILDEADRALYAAKTSGRNRVVFKSGISPKLIPEMAIST